MVRSKKNCPALVVPLLAFFFSLMRKERKRYGTMTDSKETWMHSPGYSKKQIINKSRLINHSMFTGEMCRPVLAKGSSPYQAVSTIKQMIVD